MKKKCTTKSLFMLFLLGLNFTAQAQEINVNPETLNQLKVREGIPFFEDSSSFEFVYEQLVQLEEENTIFDTLVLEQDCQAATPALRSFETHYTYESLRAKQDLKECEELAQGKSPAELSAPLINDPVLSTLFNAKGQLWINETIFYIVDNRRYFVINNGDLEAIQKIDEGKWFENSNVELFIGGGESLADFEYEKIEGNKYHFTFTGELQSGQSVLWDFGDGTTGEGIVQNYDFGTGSSSVEVCARIVQYSGNMEVSIDELCKTIDLKTTIDFSCILLIKKEKGEEGKVCFKLFGLGSKNVESVLWDFGDGNTSEELKPCHKYACNKIYFVKAHYTMKSGCKFTMVNVVNVNSYQCCDHLASNKGSIQYQNNRMLKYHLYQIPLPIIGRTIISSRHYKKKGNRYVRRPANITNSIHGKVFTSNSSACRCEKPLQMNVVETKYKSWLITNYKVGSYFQASAEEPWYGKVYINGNLIISKTVNTNCN